MEEDFAIISMWLLCSRTEVGVHEGRWRCEGGELDWCIGTSFQIALQDRSVHSRKRDIVESAPQLRRMAASARFPDAHLRLCVVMVVLFLARLTLPSAVLSDRKATKGLKSSTGSCLCRCCTYVLRTLRRCMKFLPGNMSFSTGWSRVRVGGGWAENFGGRCWVLKLY